jgi:predicted transcriptional regulator
MIAATIAGATLQSTRTSLRLSQSALARLLAGVSRFKICAYELGAGTLTPEEQSRILTALNLEAERLREISCDIQFDRNSGHRAE